jgi:membrane-bound lytic murein transglycosylase D
MMAIIVSAQTTNIRTQHKVEKSETIFGIAKKYGVTIEDIVKWNGLKDTKIKINEKLKIKTTKKIKK